MDFIPLGLGFFLLISVALNGCLAVLVRRLRRRRAKEVVDVSARDLLHDLTRRGQAIVRVDVIDPAQLMLRSPRG